MEFEFNIMPNFSNRYGYEIPEKEIFIREEAPDNFRSAIISAAKSIGTTSHDLRQIICNVLLELPDESNWSEENVFEEVKGSIMGCEWFQVYDIGKAIYSFLAIKNQYSDIISHAEYSDKINSFMSANGIGWKLENGQFIVRSSKEFEISLGKTVDLLKGSRQLTASQEISEAIQDLSRRPLPDITGAIQHSMAAMECVARTKTGSEKQTLGALVNKLELPKPLDSALKKIWGYSSEVGRHLREDNNPTYNEAEFVVALTSAIINYLQNNQSHGGSNE